MELQVHNKTSQRDAVNCAPAGGVRITLGIFMKLHTSTILMATSLLLQTGCATYQSPESSNTKITFEMADELNANSNQFYSIYPQAECDEIEGYGKAASMLKLWGMGGLDSTVDVLAGKKIYILSEIKNHSGGTTVYTNSCRNFAGFTPEENQHYTIQQIKGCTDISIINNAGPQVSTDKIKIPYSCTFAAKKF
jgi:hypothetical protein